MGPSVLGRTLAGVGGGLQLYIGRSVVDSDGDLPSRQTTFLAFGFWFPHSSNSLFHQLYLQNGIIFFKLPLLPPSHNQISFDLS